MRDLYQEHITERIERKKAQHLTGIELLTYQRTNVCNYSRCLQCDDMNKLVCQIKIAFQAPNDAKQ